MKYSDIQIVFPITIFSVHVEAAINYGSPPILIPNYNIVNTLWFYNFPVIDSFRRRIRVTGFIQIFPASITIVATLIRA